MDEKYERKLHILIEILIVAVLIFVWNLILSLLFNKIVWEIDYEDAMIVSGIFSCLQFLLSPIIAVILCMKVIEGRKIDVWKLLIIALCVTSVIRFVEIIGSNYLSRFGRDILVHYVYVETFLAPLIRAIIMVLLIRFVDAPIKEADMYDEKMQCNIVVHILLLLFTGGIWQFIWMYRITAYLNCVENEKQRHPGSEILMCMLIPFYKIYWIYKSAQRIDKLAKKVDVLSDLTIVCLILEMFVSIVPPILMQDKVNKILELN